MGVSFIHKCVACGAHQSTPHGVILHTVCVDAVIYISRKKTSIPFATTCWQSECQEGESKIQLPGRMYTVHTLAAKYMLKSKYMLNMLDTAPNTTPQGTVNTSGTIKTFHNHNTLNTLHTRPRPPYTTWSKWRHHHLSMEDVAGARRGLWHAQRCP